MGFIVRIEYRDENTRAGVVADGLMRIQPMCQLHVYGGHFEVRFNQ